MPSIVDPSVGLESFQEALQQGILGTQPAALDRTVLVHFDEPEEGKRRITYVRVSPTRKIQAMAVFTPVESIDGLLSFQLGYAVPEVHRGNGEKAIVEAAIAELRYGLGRNGLKAFHVEAIVGADNLASRKVAEATLSKEGKPTTDSHSGVDALQCVRKVG